MTVSIEMALTDNNIGLRKLPIPVAHCPQAEVQTSSFELQCYIYFWNPCDPRNPNLSSKNSNLVPPFSSQCISKSISSRRTHVHTADADSDFSTYTF